MNTQQIFRDKTDKIVKLWVEAVINCYPDRSRPALSSNMDPFTNPVGGMIREAAQGLVLAISGADIQIEQIKKSIERLIKIRAVQALSPGEAIGIIYLFKPILRAEILPQMNKPSSFSEYLDIESRLDTLAMMAFDLYVHDRDVLADIRIKEIRNQYAELKRWAQNLNSNAPLGTFTGCGN